MLPVNFIHKHDELEEEVRKRRKFDQNADWLEGTFGHVLLHCFRVEYRIVQTLQKKHGKGEEDIDSKSDSNRLCEILRVKNPVQASVVRNRDCGVQ